MIRTDRINEDESDSGSSSNSCVDNPNYSSRYGLTCAQHEALECRGFAGLGFDEAKVDELLLNCPSACRVDGCDVSTSDEKPGIDENFAVTMEFAKGDFPPKSVTATAIAATTARERERGLFQEESLDEFVCFPGWDASCADDPSFLSRLKSPCESHTQFDCRNTYLIGFKMCQLLRV